MKLEELVKDETSDENMQWDYDLIKDAYKNGQNEVSVNTEMLTERQFNYLRDVQGYKMNSSYGIDTISGW